MQLESFSPITLEETEQLVQMYNWSNGQPQFEFMLMRSFHQYNPSDKKWRLWYELESLEFINNKHRHCFGKGQTLMEAMYDYAKRREEKKL